MLLPTIIALANSRVFLASPPCFPTPGEIMQASSPTMFLISLYLSNFVAGAT